MTALRIHVFQHVSFEGPACLSQWFEARQCTVNYTRFYEAGFQFPSPDDFDRLVVMGGPMSVTDEAEYPWLKTEKALIKAAIEAGKSVVGICLGSQLIASALGEKVFKNEYTEIGWFPIYKTEAGKAEPLLAGLPDELTVLHWHGDTFDLPQGAIQLFYSEGCKNQAYLIGNKVLALQCHLEMTPESLEGMLAQVGSELVPGTYIQSAETIRANYHLMEANNRLLFGMMDLLE